MTLDFIFSIIFYSITSQSQNSSIQWQQHISLKLSFLFLPKPWVTVGFHDLQSLFQHKWCCDSKTTKWGHFLQPSLSTPPNTDAVKAWLGTPRGPKPNFDTNVQWSWVSPRKFFPSGAADPPGRDWDSPSRNRGGWREGAWVRSRKFPIAQKEEDDSLQKPSGSRVKPKGERLQGV